MNRGEELQPGAGSQTASRLSTIEDSEQKLRNLIQQATVGIVVIKLPHYQVEIVNDHYCRIFNRDAAGFKGTFFEIHPELSESFLPILDDVTSSLQPFHLTEFRLSSHRGDNTREQFLDIVFQPYNGDYDESGVMILVHDVTEKIMARKQIEYAEERARLAIESGELGVYEVNLLTDEIFPSPRFNAIYGYENTVVRSDYVRTLHPDDLPIRDEAHKKALVSGKLEYEARVIWQDGSVHWVKVNGTIFRDDAGTPVRLLGVVQDVTEQKIFSDKLAIQVQERTQELEDKNLQLEQFAYAASHDMQEPLRKIQMFGNLLMDYSSHLDSRAKEYLEKICNSISRMQQIIHDILHYSDQTKEEYAFEATPLSSIISSVEKDLEDLIRNKHAIIITDDLPVLKAIPSQIYQLFHHLISNAIKFSNPEKNPEIRITVREVPNDELWDSLNRSKKYVQLSLYDNGIGFKQEYAGQIFNLFKRLHTKSAYEGTGIGLALCKKIVINHSGEIFAHSTPGIGSVFHVLLPMQQVEKPVDSLQ